MNTNEQLAKEKKYNKWIVVISIAIPLVVAVLFGIKIPEHIHVDYLKSVLKANNIYVSFRGKYMRVSCHIFNDVLDFEKLYTVLITAVNTY